MESLHPPGHLMTGAMLGETIKETQCICGVSAIQVYAVRSFVYRININRLQDIWISSRTRDLPLLFTYSSDLFPL